MRCEIPSRATVFYFPQIEKDQCRRAPALETGGFGVGVIPLMPDYKTNLVCLDLVSMAFGTDNLDNTFCDELLLIQARAWGCLVGVDHRPVPEVPSSVLMVSLDSDARRRTFPLSGLLPLRFNALR